MVAISTKPSLPVILEEEKSVKSSEMEVTRNVQSELKLISQPTSTPPATAEMILALWEEEIEKLKDPRYPGGGSNPPYGPVVVQTEYGRRTGVMHKREHYSQLLIREYNRLSYYKDIGLDHF